ncbi:MAG: hypothetical protein V3U87_00705, partial [Methylococcaceae bacterium]
FDFAVIALLICPFISSIKVISLGGFYRCVEFAAPCLYSIFESYRVLQMKNITLNIYQKNLNLLYIKQGKQLLFSYFRQSSEKLINHEVKF